jgi:hypothetical protein
MYAVVNCSTGLIVARFSNRLDAQHWADTNNTLPAPRTAAQVAAEMWQEPVNASLYRVEKVKEAC